MVRKGQIQDNNLTKFDFDLLIYFQKFIMAFLLPCQRGLPLQKSVPMNLIVQYNDNANMVSL